MVFWIYGTFIFGKFPIETFEVVSRTPKTVVVKVLYEPDSPSDGHSENRYNLRSGDYIFLDTLEKAKLAASNVIANRMQIAISRTAELRERLQEVCDHRAITGPAKGERCIRCDFEVPNPEEYCDGG